MDFEQIYQLYSPRIFRVCMAYINDHEQAQDLTQETFIAVWKHLPSFRHDSDISTWIFRIATNNCLRAIEKSKRTRNIPLPVDIAYVPEESKEEKVKFLYQCISELSETDRIIISLVLEDLPQAEIAAIVGMNNTNIRVRIHRVKERLAKRFNEHGQFH